MPLTGNFGPNNREFEVPNIPTSSVCDGIMTTRTTNILRPATQPAGMDFTGTWKVYSEENLEEFLKEVGKVIFIFKGLICLLMHNTCPFFKHF